MYGFPSADSDFDIRGTFSYPPRLLYGLAPPKTTIDLITNSKKVDISFKEIRDFLVGITKNNGNYLEQLFSPIILYTSEEHEKIKKAAKECLSKKIFNSFHNIFYVFWSCFFIFIYSSLVFLFFNK